MFSKLSNDLVSYISDMGNCSLELGTINVKYKDLFNEENEKKKWKIVMDGVISTMLVYAKKKKSGKNLPLCFSIIIYYII